MDESEEKKILLWLEGEIQEKFPEVLALAIASGEFPIGRVRVRVFGLCMELLAKMTTHSEKEPKKVNGLTYEEIVIACHNIGYDLTCGACAGLFYTGFSLREEHEPSCFTRDFMTVCRLCQNVRGKEGKCPHCGAEVLPEDYETCSECGFDHEYEPLSAQTTHSQTEDSNG